MCYNWATWFPDAADKVTKIYSPSPIRIDGETQGIGCIKGLKKKKKKKAVLTNKLCIVHIFLCSDDDNPVDLFTPS